MPIRWLDMATYTISVRTAWWLRWYMAGLTLTCWTMGTEPDIEKVSRVIRRALTIVLVPVADHA